MKHILLIAPSSLKRMPYINLYTEIMKNANMRYTIILWDRYNEGMTDKNIIALRFPTYDKKHLNMIGYILFYIFIAFHVRRFKSAKVIIFSLQLVMILRNLLKNYDYIVDIRDYFNVKFNRNMLNFLSSASFVAISSDGFKAWLPDTKNILISHNIDSSQSEVLPINFSNHKVISYIGIMSYKRATMEFINFSHANLSDFEIRFHGGGIEYGYLKNYQSRNIKFTGEFLHEEKRNLYMSTYFVLGYYGNSEILVNSLTPNRLYESCIYGRPIIVTNGTHLAKIVDKYKIGIVLDVNNPSDFIDKSEYYMTVSGYNEYLINASKFLDDVRREQEVFRESLKKFLLK